MLTALPRSERVLLLASAVDLELEVVAVPLEPAVVAASIELAVVAAPVEVVTLVPEVVEPAVPVMTCSAAGLALPVAADVVGLSALLVGVVLLVMLGAVVVVNAVVPRDV